MATRNTIMITITMTRRRRRRLTTKYINYMITFYLHVCTEHGKFQLWKEDQEAQEEETLVYSTIMATMNTITTMMTTRKRMRRLTTTTMTYMIAFYLHV